MGKGSMISGLAAARDVEPEAVIADVFDCAGAVSCSPNRHIGVVGPVEIGDSVLADLALILRLLLATLERGVAGVDPVDASSKLIEKNESSRCICGLKVGGGVVIGVIGCSPPSRPSSFGEVVCPTGLSIVFSLVRPLLNFFDRSIIPDPAVRSTIS